jgi:hypothetical protein
MRIPRELSQIEQMITQQFSHMRPAHVPGQSHLNLHDSMAL